MTVNGLDRHIERDQNTAGGKPRIAGRRIKVRDVVIWHLRMGKSIDEICAEYDISLADAHAALAYYFDNREEIDRDIKESGEFVDALRRTTPSVLAQRLKALRGD